jgi:arylsulfatase A-like enzyme
MKTFVSLASLVALIACSLGSAGEPDAPQSAVPKPAAKVEAPKPAKKPNVLLVTLDTTRTERIGCYGDKDAQTPRLDGLAADGVRFDCAISTAGRTPMSHASILTGTNPYRHDCRVFFGKAGNRIADDVPTLAEILEHHGWQTGAALSSYPVSEHYGFKRGFQFFDCGVDLDQIDFTKLMAHDQFWQDARQSRTERRGDATTDLALDWLGKTKRDAPWFLWVHYFDVHDHSLVPPKEFAQAHGKDYREGRKIRGTVETREWVYDLEMTFMDQQFGRLLDALKERGEQDGTLVVVLADHGQGLRDGMERHHWGGHALLYQWCIRVPLIVRLPGADHPKGVAIDALVRNLDVFSTVLDVAGVEAPLPVDGRSVLPLVRGESDEPRVAYADVLALVDEHATDLPPPCKDNLFCAMDRRWKLIWHQTRPENDELFDLQSDPLELKNVASEHPDVVERLRKWIEGHGATVIKAPGERVEDPKIRELLNKLGYTSGSSGGAESDGGH